MNKKLVFTLVIPLLLSVICLQSCVTVNVTSNKDADYAKKLKKVYIMVNSAKDVDNFNERLLAGIIQKIKQKNILVEGFVRNPLSLETDKDINTKINNYDPEALLLIKQTQITYMNGGPGGGKFEITIIDGLSKKNVWKGLMDVTGPWQSDETINKIVDQLIKKMQEDNII